MTYVVILQVLQGCQACGRIHSKSTALCDGPFFFLHGLFSLPSLYFGYPTSSPCQ